MQPGRKGAAPADRSRQPGEAQKHRLEHVLGVVGVFDQPAGRPEHHRAVAGDQQLKCLAVTGCDEPPQQLGVVRRHGLVAQPA